MHYLDLNWTFKIGLCHIEPNYFSSLVRTLLSRQNLRNSKNFVLCISSILLSSVKLLLLLMPSSSSTIYIHLKFHHSIRLQYICVECARIVPQKQMLFKYHTKEMRNDEIFWILIWLVLLPELCPHWLLNSFLFTKQ